MIGNDVKQPGDAASGDQQGPVHDIREPDGWADATGQPSGRAGDASARDERAEGSQGRGDDRPAGALPTGTSAPEAAERILAIRKRIDEIDKALIALWQERAALSQEVGAVRRASGGTRLVLSRERQILEHFRDALGADGTQLALLLLRAGRGPL